jgi:hypothetical protein
VRAVGQVHDERKAGDAVSGPGSPGDEDVASVYRCTMS